MLNCNDPSSEAHIPHAEEELEINIEPPSVEVIKYAIQNLKNGKAPGIDRV